MLPLQRQLQHYRPRSALPPAQRNGAARPLATETSLRKHRYSGYATTAHAHARTRARLPFTPSRRPLPPLAPQRSYRRSRAGWRTAVVLPVPVIGRGCALGCPRCSRTYPHGPTPSSRAFHGVLLNIAWNRCKHDEKFFWAIWWV